MRISTAGASSCPAPSTDRLRDSTGRHYRRTRDRPVRSETEPPPARIRGTAKGNCSRRRSHRARRKSPGRNDSGRPALHSFPGDWCPRIGGILRLDSESGVRHSCRHYPADSVRTPFGTLPGVEPVRDSTDADSTRPSHGKHRPSRRSRCSHAARRPGGVHPDPAAHGVRPVHRRGTAQCSFPGRCSALSTSYR